MNRPPGEEKVDIASEIEETFDRLWPICRSITGDGLRESFSILREIIPLELTEVPSGTQVFDWTVPDEWNIYDAYIITPEGEKIADFRQNNLHVVNYSVPVNRDISFNELQEHLHYKKEQPDAIPYVTSYYKRRWGFCIRYNTFEALPRTGNYRIVIDSTLEKGALTLGQTVLKGSSDKEILFSSYLCHPSMANNELSGPLALTFLYRELKKLKNRRYNYRFVIAPESIGAIAFLYLNKDKLLGKVEAGYVFTCCGDDGNLTFKNTRKDESLTNRVTQHVLQNSNESYQEVPFDPIGSDERQYSSPGFNFPIGVLMRTPFSVYPEYHTSLDNKSLMDFEKMEELVQLCVNFVKAFEINDRYENQIKYCEPFLGKRELFEERKTARSVSEMIKMRLRLLNYLDGSRDLLDVCEQYDYSILETEHEIRLLLKHKLLR